MITILSFENRYIIPYKRQVFVLANVVLPTLPGVLSNLFDSVVRIPIKIAMHDYNNINGKIKIRRL